MTSRLAIVPVGTGNGLARDLSLPGVEEALERIRGLVDRYEHDLAIKMADWRSFFAGAAERGEKVVLWGSGSKAVAFLSELGSES